MRITFHGAAQQVTGSCFLFETQHTRFLVDCGLFQGSAATRARNLEPFGFEPRQIDFVILTHAHLDHSGLLPRLAAEGFKGPIHTTPATRDLLSVLLLDSAHLQEAEAERAARTARDYSIVYRKEDVNTVLEQVEPIPYDLLLELAPGVKARLRDAGHILGSSIVELSISERGQTRKVVVSGDLGQPGRAILRDPAVITEADVLLLESTYGDRNHKSMTATLDELTSNINSGIHTGVVLVPAYAVGRTQELLYYLNLLTREKRLHDLTVFVDSPMATEVTAITAHHLELFNDEARRMAATGATGNHSMRLRFTETVQDSIALNRIESGAVIIAGSGMCEGGRIRHHLKHRLSNAHTTVVIVGYQPVGTLGRLLVDGARSVRLFGDDVPVHARIVTLGGFSAHAGQDALVEWVSHIPGGPKQGLFLVHGEPRACTGLATRIKTQLGWDAHIAADRERVTI